MFACLFCASFFLGMSYNYRRPRYIVSLCSIFYLPQCLDYSVSRATIDKDITLKFKSYSEPG